MTMTHSYQYCASLPHTRKHLNAAFTHRLKKLCGKVFHIKVTEVLCDDELGEYVYVVISRADEKACILAICEAYGIGSDYIDIDQNLDNDEDADESKEVIIVYLSKKKPTY